MGEREREREREGGVGLKVQASLDVYAAFHVY